MDNNLFVRIQLEAKITAREGMLAANEERSNHGLAQAYGEEAFATLSQDIMALLNLLSREE